MSLKTHRAHLRYSVFFLSLFDGYKVLRAISAREGSILFRKSDAAISSGNFGSVRMADHVPGAADKNDGRILGQLVDILMRKKPTPR